MTDGCFIVIWLSKFLGGKMKSIVVFLSFSLGLCSLAQASEILSFVDRDGNLGKITLQTEKITTCDDVENLSDAGAIDYLGTSRTFTACWDQYRMNEKVVIGTASTDYLIDFTTTIVLNPEYLKVWAIGQKFENSKTIEGCGDKIAGAIFNFGSGPIESRLMCLDQ